MRRWKPWTRSTGPRTMAGKAASSKNAFKHGARAAPFTRYERLLKEHSAFLSNLTNAARLSRKYAYYAVPGCAAALQKLILAKGLAGHKKLKTNELLDLARRHCLIRFPKRRKTHKILAPAAFPTYKPRLSRIVEGCSGPKSPSGSRTTTLIFNRSKPFGFSQGARSEMYKCT